MNRLECYVCKSEKVVTKMHKGHACRHCMESILTFQGDSVKFTKRLAKITITRDEFKSLQRLINIACNHACNHKDLFNDERAVAGHILDYRLDGMIHGKATLSLGQ